MLEVTQREGLSWVTIKRRSFWEYIGNRTDFMKLSLKDREKVFLQWRYGTVTEETNADAFRTDQYLLSRVDEECMKNMSEAQREYWTLLHKDMDFCKNIMRDIGLLSAQPINPTRPHTQEKIDWND